MAYLDRKRFYGIIIIVLVVLLVVLGIVFATLGAADISVADGFRVLLSRVPFLKDLVEDVQLPDSFYTIVLDIRLPRLILSAMVGAALSVAGAAFQGMLKNPMADPFVVGVSSGAAFGATIAMVLNLHFVFAGLSSVGAMAFVSALATILLVYNISRTGTRVPAITLILSGVAVSAFLSAAVSFIMVISRENVHNIVYWTMGSFTDANWSAVKTVLIPIPVGIAGLMLFAKDLNMMMLGDDTARSLGVNIELTKKILLVVASIITAAAVSVSGIIGFVGLVTPHVVRLISGPDHRTLMPLSALSGAIFLMAADTFARTVIQPKEIPVGIITSLVGGPFFIYLLIKRKKAM